MIPKKSGFTPIAQTTNVDLLPFTEACFDLLSMCGRQLACIQTPPFPSLLPRLATIFAQLNLDLSRLTALNIRLRLEVLPYLLIEGLKIRHPSQGPLLHATESTIIDNEPHPGICPGSQFQGWGWGWFV